MYQSIPSLTIPPGDPRGFAHSSCPWGRVFAPLSCAGVCPRVLRSKEKFDNSKNFEKSAIFALSLKQMSSSSFNMFIYARSDQCDLGPIYTITNTQRIRIYPGKLKFILVKNCSKFHRIQDVYMANMPKKTKLYSRFLLIDAIFLKTKPFSQKFMTIIQTKPSWIILRI